MGKLFKRIIGLALGLGITLGIVNTIENKNNSVYAADNNTEYQLITSADDLEVGKSYVITNGVDGNCFAMGTASNENNRKASSITISNNKFLRGSSVLSLTLGGDETGWTFATENYAGTAGYLNASSTTSKNYLYINSKNDNYGLFTVEIDAKNYNAVITCTGKKDRNLLRYNPNGGSPIFSCYGSGQSPVYLFKEIGDSPSVKIDKEFLDISLEIDEGAIFTASTQNAGDAVITWFSSDDDIAMIDESTGEVLAISAGSATITASITVNSKTYSDSTTISVLAPDIDVEDFVINEENENVSIFEGNTFQLTIFAMPEDHNETFAWSSSDDDIAIVAENGLVTGVSEGIVTITAMSNRTNKTATCSVEVFYKAKYIDDSNGLTDTITYSFTGLFANGYKSFEEKKDVSTAVYSGTICDSGTAGNKSMQFNGDKSAIFTLQSGGIFRSIKATLKDTGSNELQVYGSNTPFTNSTSLTWYSTKPLIATLKGAGSAAATDNYKYIFIRTTAMMVYKSIEITWANAYEATIDDMKTLSEFTESFLDVAGEYNSNTNKGTGNCVSEGWYLDAKEMFNDFLSDEQRMLFMYDDYYANPRARLEAWAYANNDTYVSSSNKLDKASSKSSFVFDELEEDGGLTIMLLLLTSSSAILGLFVIYNKKKEQ